jgi:hypothetical protein
MVKSCFLRLSGERREGNESALKITNKKPGARAGFVVDAPETRATAYPAEYPYNGRRARDVMPAAARALVSTVAV